MSPAKFPGNLSRLQRDLLLAYNEASEGFFLTGGGALVGFYGSQRTTRDLDLFTRDPLSFESGSHTLQAIGRNLDCEVRSLRTFPHFRRYSLTRGDEQTLVDIVKEEVPAIFPPAAPSGWSLLIDVPEEIAVNKICALVGRGEHRDLEDLLFLDSLGVDLDRALNNAARKDGGIGPDTLLLGLQGVSARLVEDSGSNELELFRQRWIKRLKDALLPPE